MPSVQTSTLRSQNRFHRDFARRSMGLALAALTLALGACSAGDVGLNGKVFDLIGSAAGGSGSDEVKIAARPGIVVPPSLGNLPQPGANAVPEGQLAQITDHDTKKVIDKSALQAQQDAYCKVHYTQAKEHGNDVEADSAVGPLGMCRPSALKLVEGLNPFKQ